MISMDMGRYEQDPYGLHPLYIGSVRGVTLIANRPQLVAVEIERLTGKSAARDQRFATWLAFIGRPIGDRTGYEDVRCVPFGAGVRIDPDHGARFSFTDAPWLLPAMDIDDSWIDRIECELIANLRAAIQDDGTIRRGFNLPGDVTRALFLRLLFGPDYYRTSRLLLTEKPMRRM